MRHARRAVRRHSARSHYGGQTQLALLRTHPVKCGGSRVGRTEGIGLCAVVVGRPWKTPHWNYREPPWRQHGARSCVTCQSSPRPHSSPLHQTTSTRMRARIRVIGRSWHSCPTRGNLAQVQPKMPGPPEQIEISAYLPQATMGMGDSVPVGPRKGYQVHLSRPSTGDTTGDDVMTRMTQSRAHINLFYERDIEKGLCGPRGHVIRVITSSPMFAYQCARPARCGATAVSHVVGWQLVVLLGRFLTSLKRPTILNSSTSRGERPRSRIERSR
jgi:hypothetical protein